MDAIRPALLATPATGPARPLPAQQTGAELRDFEAMVVGFLVERTLPDLPGLEGAGAEIWRGMLAARIGEQIAASGTLGIARDLEATHGER